MNDGLKLLLLLLVIPASFMYLYMLLKYSIDIFKTDVIGGIVGIVLIVLILFRQTQSRMKNGSLLMPMI